MHTCTQTHKQTTERIEIPLTYKELFVQSSEFNILPIYFCHPCFILISLSHLSVSAFQICVTLSDTLCFSILTQSFLLRFRHCHHPYLVSSYLHTSTILGRLWDLFIPSFPFLSVCLLPSLAPSSPCPAPCLHLFSAVPLMHYENGLRLWKRNRTSLAV